MNKDIRSLRKAFLDSHAGEGKTSQMFFIRPDLVDIDAIKSESGLDQARLKQLQQ